MVPVIEALRASGPVSIDTQKESVARAAIKAGASVLNDVSSTLVDVAGELGVGYVAMHRQGDSSVMQLNPTYDDVVGRDRRVPRRRWPSAPDARACGNSGSTRASVSARRPSTTSR